MGKDDVVPDGNGQGVRPLENHADLFADLDQLHRGVINVLVEDVDTAFDTHVTEAFIDAVDAAQEGGFPTPRRANHGGDQTPFDVQIDIEQGLEIPIPEIEALGPNGVLVIRVRIHCFPQLPDSTGS